MALKFHVRIFLKFIICEHLEADDRDTRAIMCQLLLPCETPELAWMYLNCEKRFKKKGKRKNIETK